MPDLTQQLAAEITVPTFWLVLPPTVVIAVGWYFLLRWLIDHFIDPPVKRWIKRRSGLTDEQFAEVERRVKGPAADA